jgi:quercetin dioxygenase-like cupin family protein
LVRVLEVRVPPGDTALWHVHADRHVGVVIEAARGWAQVPGTASTEDVRKVGDIIENWKSTLPYTHRVGNADTVAFRYVIGQLLGASGIDASTLPASTTLRLESENARARVYRVILGPGQSTGFHDHAQPGLTIQVTPGTLRIEGAPPQATSAGTGAGAWWWRHAGQGHALRNTGATTIQLVEIDWR